MLTIDEHQFTDFAATPSNDMQELDFERDDADEYFANHISASSRLNEHSAGILAAARLHWLLGSSYCSLNGLFTEPEIVMCLNCFQGQIILPEQFGSIASNLCDDFGIELHEYSSSPIARLVDTLRGLSPTQMLALVDALDQTWHRGMPSGKGISEFFDELGIALI